jgi:hypothetical protein
MTTIRPRAVATLIVGVLALIAAGCGGPAQPASTATSSGDARHQALLAYAQCMRAHGVPDFPDLTSGALIQATNNKVTIDGHSLSVSASTFQAADQACRSKLEASTSGGAPNPQVAQNALKFAECMRAHGVPDFPDPKVSGNSVQIAVPKGAGDNPQFKSAQQACQSIMKPGGNGG